MDPIALNDMLKGLLMKDLRIQCRARGITPAGSREALLERLRDDMLATNDLCAPPPALCMRLSCRLGDDTFTGHRHLVPALDRILPCVLQPLHHNVQPRCKAGAAYPAEMELIYACISRPPGAPTWTGRASQGPGSLLPGIHQPTAC